MGLWTSLFMKGEALDNRIEKLWKNANRLGWSKVNCKKKVSIYTEILGLVDKSSKYNACSSLRNRAISYRILKRFDEALKDLRKELEIAQKIGDQWRVVECQRTIEETLQLKHKDEVEADDGEKATKFRAMKQQVDKLLMSSPKGEAAFESLFTDLANDDVDVRAEASRLLADSPHALNKLANVYQEFLRKNPRKSVLAGRVIGRKADMGKGVIVHAKIGLAYGIQAAFTPCGCGHCGKLNSGIPVPEGGLYIPFHAQKNDKGATYALPVLCDYCGKEFFIAWDSDPR